MNWRIAAAGRCDERQQALAQAHNILGILARTRDEAELARWRLEQSLALSQGFADPTAQIAALNNLALVYGASGDPNSRNLAHGASVTTVHLVR
jgi:hypothetical protein